MPKLENFKRIQIEDKAGIDSKLQHNWNVLNMKNKYDLKRQIKARSQIELLKDDSYQD